MNYFTDYPIVTSFLPIFLISFWFAKYKQDRKNMGVFMVFFVSGPFIFNNLFENWNYYIFFGCYEFLLLNVLFWMNGLKMRIIPLYLVQIVAMVANFGAYEFYSDYPNFIHKHYELLNLVLIHASFLFIIAFIDELKAISFSFLLWILPIAIGLSI